MRFVLFAISCLQVLGVKYCATISPSEALGASGYFAMDISNGVGKYAYYLDISQMSTYYCQYPSQGLAYHLHSYWLFYYYAQSGAGWQACSSTITGGHYDPYYACSAASQEFLYNCKYLKQTYKDGYEYTCNETYAVGMFSTCEVGDLSGKFGAAKSTNKIYQSSTTLYDYLPPIAANFKDSMRNSEMWTSVVFHCLPDQTPLVCSSFSSTYLSPCQDAFDQMAASSPYSTVASSSIFSSSLTYSKASLTLGVSLSVITSLICGIFLGALVVGRMMPSRYAPPYLTQSLLQNKV